MSEDKYLADILESQTLADYSDEMKELRSRRSDVEALLRRKFAKSSPTIRYGGSKAKGTMIVEAYDLDVICYFDHGDKEAGESLEEIYSNVEQALSEDYLVARKSSALRLKSRDVNNWAADFHIDVVPGRFIDDKQEDVFLYRSSGDKGRLKTNLDVHIDHVKDSGVTDAIKLLKLWRARNNLSVRHFVLELLIVKLLKGKSDSKLADQLKYVWTELRDNIENLKVEDPANPTGNDLSELFNPTVTQELFFTASTTLGQIDRDGWEKVFGPVLAKLGRPLTLPGYTARPTGSFGE